MKLYDKIMKDSLYANSIYLMLSSAVMAGFGFFSWLIIARLFDVHDVGLATTMISAMGLIASLSILGFNVGLIRFLPNSSRRDDKINTGFTLVVIFTVIVSAVFLMGLKWFSPDLVFIRDSLVLSFLFIFFMVVSVSSSLIESVFISLRSAKFILIKNSIFGFLRVFLPFVFVGFGAFGIFSAYVSALFVGFGVVWLFLVYSFDYRPRLVFYDDIIRQIGKYSLGNYVAGFVGGAGALVLPLLITNVIGASVTAYYFIAVQVANLLYVIPTATTNSLFAEGSYNEKGLKEQVWKAVKIICVFLIPAIVLILFFGNYVLLAFGSEYSSQAFSFLKVMALSGVFVSINSVFVGVAKVNKRIWKILFVNIIGFVCVVGLSYLFILQGFGLLGIGYGWLISRVVMNLIYGVLKLLEKGKV